MTDSPALRETLPPLLLCAVLGMPLLSPSGHLAHPGVVLGLVWLAVAVAWWFGRDGHDRLDADAVDLWTFAVGAVGVFLFTIVVAPDPRPASPGLALHLAVTVLDAGWLAFGDPVATVRQVRDWGDA